MTESLNKAIELLSLIEREADSTNEALESIIQEHRDAIKNLKDEEKAEHLRIQRLFASQFTLHMNFINQCLFLVRERGQVLPTQAPANTYPCGRPHTPNAETIAALEESRQGEVERVASWEEEHLRTIGDSFADEGINDKD